MPRIQRKEEPKSRLKRLLIGCGIGCGSGALVLLIILGIIYTQLTAPPPNMTPNPASIAGPPSASSAGGASTDTAAPSAPQPPPVQAQVDEIKRAVATNQPTPVTLRVSEAQINQLVAEKLNAGSPIRNARVALRSGDVVITGTAEWKGRDWYITAAATPQAVAGRLGFRVDSVQVGRFPLPPSAVSRIQAEIDKGMADGGPVGKDVQVTGVSIANGAVTVSGQTVPH